MPIWVVQSVSHFFKAFGGQFSNKAIYKEIHKTNGNHYKNRNDIVADVSEFLLWNLFRKSEIIYICENIGDLRRNCTWFYQIKLKHNARQRDHVADKMNQNVWAVNISRFQKVSKNQQCSVNISEKLDSAAILLTLWPKYGIELDGKATVCDLDFHWGNTSCQHNVETFLKMLDDAKKSK